MIFSSITFLFYFLPVFLFFYFISKHKNGTLLFGSLFFYAWGESGYVLLLMASIIVNYGIGLRVSQSSSRGLWLTLGVTLNLIPLILFKYMHFFVHSINPLIETLKGAPISFTPLHLPLGISFFTFQAISYIIDVYRNETPAEKSIFPVALYISMFPQLLAGPIVRFRTISNALAAPKNDASQFSSGVRSFLIGLSQKVLLANTLTQSVDQIFSLPLSEIRFSLSWLAAIGYTLQIYYDFAGYSNMAIGLGRMMGFELPQNFNYPYLSQSITEFWRRWHITLSQWFRDYLYIPLGGNRKGAPRLYLNLLIVFFICGLWHGASYTFVAWGLYYGFFLIIERMGLKNLLAKAPIPLRRLYALLIIVVGWVLFRSDSFEQALTFIQAMAGLKHGEGIYAITPYLSLDMMLALVIGCIVSGPHSLLRNALSNTMRPLTINPRAAWSPVIETIGLIMSFVLVAMFLASGVYHPFIYFQF